MSLSLGLLFSTWLALAPALVSAANPHCANAFFWHTDNSRTPGGPNWSSYGKESAFVAGPCLGLSGIGTTQTFLKTVLVIDRSAAQNGYLALPGRPQDLAYAQEVELATGRQRGLDVITNTFCSSGQHGPGGTFLSIGGDWSPDYAAPGEFSIRAFAPCTDATCGFSIVDNLTNSRWYPTSALLGDGRVIIVGGSSKGVGLNKAATNVPFIEYFPKKPGVSHRAQFLVDTLPYNLFPFVHLLPSGRVFLFAGQDWALWDTTANDVVPGDYPPVGAVDAQGARLMQSYPLAGTSALLPLVPATGYAAEVIICGGGGVTSIYFGADGKVVEDYFYPSSNQCFRISPEAKAPKWAEEVPMSQQRVMPVGVLLPDGGFLVISGTKTGHSGLGPLAHNATLVPDLYNSATHTWHKAPLVASKVARAYHSSAIVLHDGSVFLTGSNPNSKIVEGPVEFPTEFRSEFFLPPYMMPGKTPPSLVRAPRKATYGATISLSFKYPIPGALAKDIKVVLVQPGFSTHGGNHGMRNVELALTATRAKGTLHAVSAAVPLNRNLVPPTWYWLFVVVNGVPNRDGHHIFIQ